MPYIKAKTGAKIGLGEHINEVQRICRPVFNATHLKTDGSDFDRLFRDGERFNIGELEAEVIHTPLHTPVDITYAAGGNVTGLQGQRLRYGNRVGVLPQRLHRPW